MDKILAIAILMLALCSPAYAEEPPPLLNECKLIFNSRDLGIRPCEAIEKDGATYVAFYNTEKTRVDLIIRHTPAGVEILYVSKELAREATSISV